MFKSVFLFFMIILFTTFAYSEDAATEPEQNSGQSAASGIR